MILLFIVHFISLICINTADKNVYKTISAFIRGKDKISMLPWLIYHYLFFILQFDLINRDGKATFLKRSMIHSYQMVTQNINYESSRRLIIFYSMLYRLDKNWWYFGNILIDNKKQWANYHHWRIRSLITIYKNGNKGRIHEGGRAWRNVYRPPPDFLG